VSRLEFSQEQVGDSTIVVAVRGEVDLSNFAELDQAIRAAELRGGDALVIDLSRLAFIDVRGLGVLADCQERRRAARLSLVVVMKPHVRKIVDVLGGSPPLIETAASRDDALARSSQKAKSRQATGDRAEDR
jgi:anti-anti-sigma factor